jgi:Zn-dependent M28 family amino/carboxypeptidase
MRPSLLPAALLAALLTGCGDDSPAPTPTAASSSSTAAASSAAAEPAADESAVPKPPTGNAGGPEPQLASYTQFLKDISSDAMEGRGPGTAGERRTVAYLVEALKQMGVGPGPDGSYTQAVPMVEFTGEVSKPLTFMAADASLQPKFADDYVVASHREVEESGVSGAEMVFVGYGVVAPEYQWNDYAGVDVKGKVVVTLVNDPGFARGDETLFKGRAMTYYGRWTYKFEEAVRQGAAGALIIHDDAGASYGWDVVKNSWTGPEYDLPAPADGQQPLAIQGWLSGATGEALLKQSGLDLKTLRDAADRPGFKPQPLKSLAEVSVRNRIRKVDSQNVFGLIKGSEKPDEAVIYVAHWDHLGRAFGQPDGIFNGAIDNGTGVAGVLEIARAMATGTAPKRSVGFLFVTLEESGLLGSKYYTQHPLLPLKDTVAAINLDAMHVIGPTRDMIVIGHGNSDLEDLLAAQLKAQGERMMRPEPTPENGFYYRSDHFNFAKAGVPALYPKTGVDHREKGEAYGKGVVDDFNKNRYHKPSDQFDPAWDLSGMIEDLKVILGVGATLANGSDWPNWREGNEFKAARDKLRP